MAEIIYYGDVTNNIYYELNDEGEFYLGVYTNTPSELPDYEQGNLPFWHNDDIKYLIKKATINKNITKLGTHTFWACSNLSEIIFEENSLCETINPEAFSYVNITTLTLPMALKEIDILTNFGMNSSIENIYVQPNNQYFQSINGILYNNPDITSSERLKLLYYPGSRQDTTFISHTNYICSYAFSYNRYLETLGFSITEEQFDFVIEDNAIIGCNNLTLIDLMMAGVIYIANLSNNAIKDPFGGRYKSLTILCMPEGADENGNRYNATIYSWVEALNFSINSETSGYKIQMQINQGNLPNFQPDGAPNYIYIDFLGIEKYALSDDFVEYRIKAVYNGVGEYDITSQIPVGYRQNDTDEYKFTQSGKIPITNDFKEGNLYLYQNIDYRGGTFEFFGDIQIVASLNLEKIKIILRTKDYYVNDIFNNNSYSVIAVYEGGVEKDKTSASSIIITDPNGEVFLTNNNNVFSIVGTYTVTPSYGNPEQIETDSFNVTKEYNGIKIVTIPTKTQYEVNNSNEQIDVSINGIEIYAYWKTSFYNSNSIYKEKINGGYNYNPKNVGVGLNQKITISYTQEGYNKILTDAYYIDVKELIITEFKWTQEYDLIDGTRGKMSENAYIPNEYGGLCPVSAKQWNLFIDTLQPFYNFQFTKAEQGKDFYILYNQLMSAIKDEYIQQGFKIRKILSYDLFKDLADFLNYKLANAPSPTNE